MKSLKNIVLSLLLISSSYCWGQNQDFGIWTGFKVSKKMDKNWSVFGEIQSRFSQNVSTLQNSFIQGGAKYKFSKWYELGGVYRYSSNGDFDANRFDIDNVFKYKINKENSVALRLKYTKSFVTHKIKGDRFRVRLKYEYRVNKKFTPYAKAQYFYTRIYDFSNWNLQRYTLGAVIRVAKKNFVDVFFNYQFEYNVANPITEYIFGLKYKLKYK